MSTTFRQRIQWILEHRPEFHGSESELSIAAGLSRTGLNKIIERSELADGVPRMRAATARNLAEQARVDRTWLETGKGTPDLTISAITSTDTHPLRREAADLLKIGNPQISDELAWFLMRDVTVDKVTVRDFFAAGVKALEEHKAKTATVSPTPKTPTPPEVPEARISSASGKMRRR